jgi:NDP-sugar pyrophosphorylase family protein
MAGGKGTRLDPFTRILPKPLIPIGDKAIIDIIMERFSRHGVKEYFVSVNHKAKMIRSYFEEMATQYRIHYIEEEKPLGTAGSLKFLKDRIKDSVLVSNCDTIIDCDYSEITKFHKNNNYQISIVGSLKHFIIPYGICEIENGGLLRNLTEKPEYDYLVNTGMYILTNETLDLIPENQQYHITDLIKTVKNNGGRIGVFPISEKSWIDIGQWDEYRKSLKSLRIE